MYTINIRGKQNPKDTKMVKLEIIFFKTGYARVPKVINITGLLKDWDVKSQSFRVPVARTLRRACRRVRIKKSENCFPAGYTYGRVMYCNSEN